MVRKEAESKGRYEELCGSFFCGIFLCVCNEELRVRYKEIGLSRGVYEISVSFSPLDP